MKKDSFFMKSKCDGLDIYVTLFIPNGKAKGIVQFAHGMVEHQIYYYDFMEYLCDRGYICVINDHRGHGKSVKNDKDLGYFYEEKGDYIVEDFHQVTEYVKDKYKNLDVYLFGHSMGSLVVRKYLKKYDKDIKKLIVCGSPSITKITGFGLFLCRLIKLFKGERYRSRFLNGFVLTNNGMDTWLSKNKEYLKEASKDKYCRYIFTVNGFINLIYLVRDVYSKSGWVLENKDLDVLFIAGSDDIIIKSESKYIKSINFLKDRGYSNTTYKLYEDCYHSVFKDKPDEVFKDVLDFIEK